MNDFSDSSWAADPKGTISYRTQRVISVNLSVRTSIHPSVNPSVHPSVRSPLIGPQRASVVPRGVLRGLQRLSEGPEDLERPDRTSKEALQRSRRRTNVRKSPRVPNAQTDLLFHHVQRFCREKYENKKVTVAKALHGQRFPLLH